MNLFLLVVWVGVDLLDPDEEFLRGTGLVVLLQGGPDGLQILIKHSEKGKELKLKLKGETSFDSSRLAKVIRDQFSFFGKLFGRFGVFRTEKWGAGSNSQYRLLPRPI